MSLERLILEKLQTRRFLNEELKSGQFYKDKSNTNSSEDEHVNNPDGTRYTVGKDETGNYGVWHMTKDGDYVDSEESDQSFSDINKAKEHALKTRSDRYRESLDSEDYSAQYEIDVLDALRDAGLTADPLSSIGQSGKGIILNIDGRRYKLLIDENF